jgi:hypothetical protein
VVVKRAADAIHPADERVFKKVGENHIAAKCALLPAHDNVARIHRAARDASEWLREFTEAVFENFAIRAEFSEPFHLFI